MQTNTTPPQLVGVKIRQAASIGALTALLHDLQRCIFCIRSRYLFIAMSVSFGLFSLLFYMSTLHVNERMRERILWLHPGDFVERCDDPRQASTTGSSLQLNYTINLYDVDDIVHVSPQLIPIKQCVHDS